MAQYLLLLYHDGAARAKLDPEVMQQAMLRYQAWRQKLTDEGHYLDSHKLENEPGRVVRNASGKILDTDGSYRETKEGLGAYYLIEARTYEVAAEISRSCPHLAFGSRISGR